MDPEKTVEEVEVEVDPSEKMKFQIRAAVREDCREIHRMITELAEFENLSEQVRISHKELEDHGFGPTPFFECLLAQVPKEEDDEDAKGFTVAGYALYFYTYSTWRARALHLEDLYVRPEFRGRGIGSALLSKVAEVAKTQHCARLQLSVLEWNTSSRDFYSSRGARDLTVSEGWHLVRFDGEHLDNLAKEVPKS